MNILYEDEQMYDQILAHSSHYNINGRRFMKRGV